MPPDLHVICSSVFLFSHASQRDSLAPAGGLGTAVNSLPMLCTTSASVTAHISLGAAPAGSLWGL